MLHRLNNRLCGAVSSYVAQTRNTVIVKRVHKPPLIGTNPMTTPQKIIDKAVVHSDDDKWMLYEVEPVQPKKKINSTVLSRSLRNINCTTVSSSSCCEMLMTMGRKVKSSKSSSALPTKTFSYQNLPSIIQKRIVRNIKIFSFLRGRRCLVPRRPRCSTTLSARESSMSA